MKVKTVVTSRRSEGKDGMGKEDGDASAVLAMVCLLTWMQATCLWALGQPIKLYTLYALLYKFV